MSKAAIPALLALLSCAGGGTSASSSIHGEARLGARGAEVAAPPPCDVGGASEWRAIATASAPTYGNVGYRATWTAHGMVVLRHDGGGGVYDPCADQWRSVEPSRDAAVSSSMLPSNDALVFITDRAHPVGGSVFDIRQRAWQRLPEAPNHLGAHAALAWTGSKLFVWGGVVPRPAQTASGHPSIDTGEGAIFDIATGAWRTVYREGAPTARAKAVAVWTGKWFVVWGGASHSTESGMLCPHSIPSIESGCVYRPNGAVYDPVTDRWRELPHEGEPPKMIDPVMIWTGQLVLLWDQVGGKDGNPLYALDPGANRWRTLGNMPLAYRSDQVGISDGRVFFLNQDSGHLFDVAKGRWNEIRVPGDLRGCHKAVAFEADRVIFLAPAYCHRNTVSIASFNLRANTWTTRDLPRIPVSWLPGPNAPPAVFSGLLVWTGAHVIGWGGSYGPGGGPHGCENPPPDQGCDPYSSPTTPSNKGFLIKPAL